MILKSDNNKILEATCDICGNDCMNVLYTPKDSEGDSDEHDIELKEFEGMQLRAIWGYTSKDKDGEIWQAVVCEDCVDKILSKKINFYKSTYM